MGGGLAANAPGRLGFPDLFPVPRRNPGLGATFQASPRRLPMARIDSEDGHTELNATEARQGVSGHNVRAVLFSGIGLAIIAGVILYFSVGT
jgi:hypothetical protein